MVNITEFAKQLKDAAEDLSECKNEGGCYCFMKKEMKDTPINKNLFIVLGWTQYDNQDAPKDRYYDDGFRLAIKVGYQAVNSIMQTDYDIDFNQVYNEKIGDTCISELLLYENTDFKDVANIILICYKHIIKNWKEYAHE